MEFPALVGKQDRNQIGRGKREGSCCSCLSINPAELESPLARVWNWRDCF